MRMKATSAAVSKALVLLLCSIAPSTHYADTRPIIPSELLAQVEAYDGQNVVVRAWLRFEPEAIQIWDARDLVSFAESERRCIGLLVHGSEQVRELGGNDVIVTGVFRRQLPSNVVALAGCTSGAFLELKSIKPL